MREAELISITYTKESTGDVTDRVIIPFTVPHTTIRAIDVTGLSEADQSEMVGLVTDYKEYIAGVLSTAYKFEDWIDHSKNSTLVPKWRTFNPSNIKTPE